MRSIPARRRRIAALLAGVVSASAGLTAVFIASAGPALAAGIPTLSPLSVTGRGAVVPFIEHEAEYAASNGTTIGPTRYYGQLASEASGRQAVTLNAVGQYVEFTLTAPANAMTVRYSIPDANGGQGVTAPINLLVNGSVLKSLNFTTNYSWYYGGYPFNNNPGDTNPHHFFDETRTLLGQTYPAGTRIRVQVSSTSVVPSFTIDLADFEVAVQYAKPAGALDVVADFAADPTGATDNTAKFQAAVDAGKAQGRAVYIPAGNYTLWDHVVVDGVTLQGAGPWYSVLGGRHPTQRNRAAGIYGKYVPGGGYTGPVRAHEANGPSQNVVLKDFAIIGDIRERVDDDQVNAMGGAMSNSTVDNVWMENTKVGAWMDGPMTNFTIKNSRILDQTADAVNFHWGVSNSKVTNTFVRNPGDDGLAIWCQQVVCPGNSFDHNTVILPILANNIVIYGSSNTNISDNVMSDTITNGGGLHIANRYPGVTGPTAVSGTITAARNTLIRAGNSDFNWQFGVGAIWFSGLNTPVTGATINITDSDILDSSYQALGFIEGSSSGINFKNINIDGAGTYAFQAQANSQMTMQNVTVKNVSQPNPYFNCVGSGFQITDLGGNSGFNLGSSVCTGQWPTPIWTYGGVPANGSGTGPTSTPSPGQTTTGIPTVPPTTAPPGCNPGTGNMAQGKVTTASTQQQSYVPANATDGNASTYWESANNAFPQTLTVDLCAAASVNQVTLRLPPTWGQRNQTVAVSRSLDGTSYTSTVAATSYTFPVGGSVNITFGSVSARYVRLTFTANTGWPAGQLSEFEVRGSGVPPTTPPVTTPPPTTTPPPPTTTPPPTTPPPTTPPPTTPPANVNLALGKTASSQSFVDVYQANRVNDGNASTYWESVNNSFPQWLQLDLNAQTVVRRIVVKLPPSASWATRTQTIAVQGSNNGTAWTQIIGATAYIFNPASGNQVTIVLPAGTNYRYYRLVFSSNSGWPAGQASEFELYSNP